jgi:hypothetical protein
MIEKKKFKDYIGEFFFYRPGTKERVSIEIRPAFRVIIHDEREDGGELFFLNTRQLQARMNQQGWHKEDESGDEILPLREDTDSGNGSVPPPESRVNNQGDLQRILDDPRFMPLPPHTLEGAYPHTEADPKSEKWIRFEHRKKGKFNLWHQVKSITGSQSRWTRPVEGDNEPNWIVTQFRCGNVIARTVAEFRAGVEFGSRPELIAACNGCFSMTRPWEPPILGIAKESLGWYALGATGTQEM